MSDQLQLDKRDAELAGMRAALQAAYMLLGDCEARVHPAKRSSWWGNSIISDVKKAIDGGGGEIFNRLCLEFDAKLSASDSKLQSAVWVLQSAEGMLESCILALSDTGDPLALLTASNMNFLLDAVSKTLEEIDANG